MADCVSRSRDQFYPISNRISSLHRQKVSFQVEELAKVADSHKTVRVVRVSYFVQLRDERSVGKEPVVPAMVKVEMSIDHDSYVAR